MIKKILAGPWGQAFRTVALSLILLLIYTTVQSDVPTNAWRWLTALTSTSKGADYWAQEISKGGYILHFRHTERDKWLENQIYDLLEDRSADALEPLPPQADVSKEEPGKIGGGGPRPGNYFDDAVCLSPKGEIQARAMGDIFKAIGFPVGKVYSSVSCRAKQMAIITFSQSPQVSRLLLYQGLFQEDASLHRETLKEFYTSIQPAYGENTVVSGHDYVLSKEMFLNSGSLGELNVGEGGFYVISIRDGGLVLEHTFGTFWSFAKNFFPRQSD